MAEGSLASVADAVLEIAQAFVDRAQQFDRKHRRFLDREQELLAIHHQQPAIGQGPGIAVAAMVMGDQGTGSEDITGLDRFVGGITIPAQLNRALQQAEHAITRLAGAEDNVSRGNRLHFTLAGEGSHGVESMHGGSRADRPLSVADQRDCGVIGGLRLKLLRG